jgi:phage terminase small subunit
MPALENAKHEAFARAIVEGKSGRDAYRAAGYKPKNDATADACASRLLADAKVSARVAELKGAAADTTVMSAREVLQELSKLGRSSIKHCIVQGDDTGEVVASLRDMPDEVAAAIQELQVEYYTEAGDDELEDQEHGGKLKRGRSRTVKRVRLKLHPKTPALELLGKHFKLYVEKHEHSDPDGRPLGAALSDNMLEVARRMAFVLHAGTRAAAKSPKKSK